MKLESQPKNHHTHSDDDSINGDSQSTESINESHDCNVNAISDEQVYTTITTNISDKSRLKQPVPNLGRDTISWLDFEKKKTNINASYIGSRVSESVRRQFKIRSMLKSFRSYFPLFQWMRKYSWKGDFFADLVAGFTIAILHIPQGIAYSILIGIGPVYGLYVSFFPVLIYAFMGSSQHISIGTMAVVDIMLAQSVKKYAFVDDDFSNSTEPTTDIIGSDVDPCSHHHHHNHDLDPTFIADPLEVLTSICLLTGLFQVMMGFFRMGNISMILSDQLISGFSCGASVHVIASQLSTAFQLKVESTKAGPLHVIREIVEAVTKVGTCNMMAVIMTIIVIVVILSFKEIIEPLLKKKKFETPIPIDLMLIILGTVLCKYLGLDEEYSLEIMGNIPTGLPMPKPPRIDILQYLIRDSLIIAVISFAINLSLGKIYAKKHGYALRANQEFLAIGFSNIFACFFQCFPATSSLSRTSMMGKHAKTQISSIVSCCVLLFVLLYFAPSLYNLPKSIVAAIIILSQKPIIFQIKDLSKSWKLSRYEGLIWFVTFISVVLLGLDIGLMVGVIFSVLTILMRFYSPKLRLLGQFPYSEIYVDIKQHSLASEIPGYPDLEDCMVSAVIIDCSAMSFIDSAGADVIAEIANELHDRSVQVALAACPQSVVTMLTKIHFFTKSPYTIIFPAVHEAVVHFNSTSLGRKLIYSD